MDGLQQQVFLFWRGLEFEFDNALHTFRLQVLALFDVPLDDLCADRPCRANIIRWRPERIPFPDQGTDKGQVALTQTACGNALAKPGKVRWAFYSTVTL